MLRTIIEVVIKTSQNIKISESNIDKQDIDAKIQNINPTIQELEKLLIPDAKLEHKILLEPIYKQIGSLEEVAQKQVLKSMGNDPGEYKKFKSQLDEGLEFKSQLDFLKAEIEILDNFITENVNDSPASFFVKLSKSAASNFVKFYVQYKGFLKSTDMGEQLPSFDDAYCYCAKIRAQVQVGSVIFKNYLAKFVNERSDESRIKRMWERLGRREIEVPLLVEYIKVRIALHYIKKTVDNPAASRQAITDLSYVIINALKEWHDALITVLELKKPLESQYPAFSKIDRINTSTRCPIKITALKIENDWENFSGYVVITNRIIDRIKTLSVIMEENKEFFKHNMESWESIRAKLIDAEESSTSSSQPGLKALQPGKVSALSFISSSNSSSSMSFSTIELSQPGLEVSQPGKVSTLGFMSSSASSTLSSTELLQPGLVVSTYQSP